MNKRILLPFLASFFCLNLFSQAVPYTYNYTTTSTSPTFNRPLTGNPPTGLSGVGTAVRYVVFGFVPSITGSYTFTNTTSYDAFGFLYQGTFNPASPLTNVLVGDDDGGSGPSNDDYLITRTLTAGVSYILVSTGFANTDFGAGTTIITGPSGAVLPVKWLSVTGSLSNQNKGTTAWKVQEQNVSHYLVEKSINGADYLPIATVPSKGDGINEYSFTDPSEIIRNTFYRVKQIDFDAQTSYSRIIQLQVKQQGVVIYPNPVQGDLPVQVSVGQELLQTSVRLISLNGLVLQTMIVQQNNFSIDLSRYASGIYVLQFENGSSYRLVKN
jgi:Secretion system C-terminal sorting domain